VTLVPTKGIVLAFLVALIMHTILFTMVELETAGGMHGSLIPPNTTYLNGPKVGPAPGGIDVRSDWSPVLFSLPSGVGFSSALAEHDVKTRLSFSQPVQAEQFHSVDPVSLNAQIGLVPREMMTSSRSDNHLAPPTDLFKGAERELAPPRVHITSGLKERLEGGIVFPPELNQPAESPWEVRASVAISERGIIEHVLISKPIEPAEINQQVIRLIHSLRFKPGVAAEGVVAIYSPAGQPPDEVVP
jgi:hypothetical protein